MGATDLYQLMLSRTEPNAYSNRTARSFPELREYASEMFASMEQTAAYNWPAISSVMGSARTKLGVTETVGNQLASELKHSHATQRVLRVIDGSRNPMSHAAS
jgi:hypothetical protein